MILSGFVGVAQESAPKLIHVKLENYGATFYFLNQAGSICSSTGGEYDIPSGIIVERLGADPIKYHYKMSGEIDEVVELSGTSSGSLVVYHATGDVFMTKIM